MFKWLLILLFIFSGCSQASLPQIDVKETLPEISLITEYGEISSNEFLDDNRPEFLLFISPFWGTCVSELRKLSNNDQGLSDISNIYVIAMNPGYSIESIQNLSNGHPEWIYAVPKDNDTLKTISGLTRSTKILVDSQNNIIERYRMGVWDVNQWIQLLEESL